jgi:hypothetical protein
MFFELAAVLAMLAIDPSGMYLPAPETGGSEFQFNPASPELRQAVSAPEPRKGDLLDARALADDLVFLRRALRKQYIGYPELLQLPDFDVEGLFDQQIARLRSGPPKVTVGDSVLALFLELRRNIVDRHFVLASGGWNPEDLDDYAEYQTAITGPAPSLAACTAPRAAPTSLRVAALLAADGKPGQLLTVSARPQGPALELACGQRRIPLSRRPPASHEDGISSKPAYEWRRAGEAAVIRIRRFTGTPADLDQLEQLSRDYPAHRRSRLIVVDLRGNSGGNSEYAHRWIRQARRGAWQSEGGALYPVGSLIAWWWWNQEVWQAINQDRVDDPAWVARRNQWRQKWPRSPAELSLEFKAGYNQGDAKVPYRGRIFVLVDRWCGSSGESAALAFREALGAKLVGERTSGKLEYGNVRPLVLPRTRLIFYFPTKRNYFPSPIEAVGAPVDVYLPSELMAKRPEELIPLLKKAAGTMP